MSKSELTFSEVLGSMTGYDEDAIAASFGKPLEDLDEIQIIRAAVFVVERRAEGTNDKTALKAAKSLTRKDVMDYFAPLDEASPDEPDTPAGND